MWMSWFKAQDQAEQSKLGIWQRPEYAPMPVSSLTEAGHTGWTRLVGKVVNVRTTRSRFIWSFPIPLRRVSRANGRICFPM